MLGLPKLLREIIEFGFVPNQRVVACGGNANSGSVGNPFDGDARASYLLLEGGAAEIVRVDYDIEREVAALTRSDYPDAARIAEMRRTGTFVRVAA